jgi:hypothetical protein
MFVTHWPYGTTTEVHGLTDKAMHVYIGTAEDPLRIVRGGIFGGQLPHIECVVKAYVIALHQTLSDGYVGTEECIWAIIFARFPYLFAGFDNNSLGNHGDNCASFQKNNMVEDDIRSGRASKFVSPPIPEFPSWWTPDMVAARKAGADPMAAAAAAASGVGGGGGSARGGTSNNGGPHASPRAARQVNALLRAGAVNTRPSTLTAT